MEGIEIKVTLFPETWRSSNCYHLSAKESVLIDPGLGPEAIALEVNKLFATHGHFDHVAGVDLWRKDDDLKLWLNEADHKLLADTAGNCSDLFRLPTTFKPAEEKLVAGYHPLSDNLRFQVILTPGHTAGSVCLLLEGNEFLRAKFVDNIGQEINPSIEVNAENYQPIALFTGDTIFFTSIGRTDFYSGDWAEMQRSLKLLKKLLSELPADLPVLPGHGYTTTAGRLLKFNPYLKQVLL